MEDVNGMLEVADTFHLDHTMTYFFYSLFVASQVKLVEKEQPIGEIELYCMT